MIWRSILIGVILGTVPIVAYIVWDIADEIVSPKIEDWIRQRYRRKAVTRLVGSGHYTKEEAQAFVDENWPAR